MKTATTRQRLQRLRAGTTRSVQQDIARAQTDRLARQAALDQALDSLDCEAGDDAAMLAVRDTCRLRMLPEIRQLRAQVSEAEAVVEQRRSQLVDAWRQEKLADEMVENEGAALRVDARRAEDAAGSEAGAQLWWRHRAA